MQKESTGSSAFPFFGDFGKNIISAMILVSLVPLVVVAYQGYHCARQALLEAAEQHLRSLLQGTRKIAESWFQERFKELNQLAHLAAPLSEAKDLEGLKQQLAPHLSAVAESSSAYCSLWVYDASWRQVVHAGAAGDSAAFDPAFRTRVTAEAEPVVGRPCRQPDGEVTVPVGRSFRKLSGAFAGAVVGRLTLGSQLTSRLRDRRFLPEEASFELLVPREKDVVLSWGKKRARRGAEGYAGEAPGILTESTTLRTPAWILRLTLETEGSLWWLRILRMRATVTALGTLVVVVLLSLYLTWNLVRPLRELVRVADRIRRGEVDCRVGPLQGAEASCVRDALNRMLDELQRSRKRLITAASLASVGELSSQIVHEVRNPLSSIKMNLQALKERVKGDPVHHELAQIAENQVGRLERMLNDLLAYGRPVTPHRKHVPFSDLVADIKAVASEQAQKKNVTLCFEGPLDHRLFCDRELLCRALSNLVLNAISVTGPGLTVKVTAEPDTRGGSVVTVLDTGPGLSPHVRENLFRPFFTTKPEGTGLGLANVKKIIDLHGGTVRGDTAPQGAVFTVHLPGPEETEPPEEGEAEGELKEGHGKNPGN